jgi:anhydro-N-acetylmuramic acid kinase
LPKDNLIDDNLFLIKESSYFQTMNKLNVIGLMSGTSLDGLDIVYAEFIFDTLNGIKNFKIIQSESYNYSNEFINKLKKSTKLNLVDFLKLDKKIGQIFGEFVNDFISKYKIEKEEVHAIASHGQTTFHQPENGFTSQIGCGDTIAVLTGIPVINDFRTKDVVLGGQGAPLVPIGDFSLFENEANCYLNLGGIANISFKKENEIVAFDICPANHPINKIVKQFLKINFDKGGEVASQGKVDKELLSQLNHLEYYTLDYPKSLGTEWLEREFYPLIAKSRLSLSDLLATIVRHEVEQINKVLEEKELSSVFITGGGALNTFFIDELKSIYSGKIIIPNKEIIEFKEALIFAYLGTLYLNKKPNILKSVTGAKRDSIGGVLHLP